MVSSVDDREDRSQSFQSNAETVLFTVVVKSSPRPFYDASRTINPRGDGIVSLDYCPRLLFR